MKTWYNGAFDPAEAEVHTTGEDVGPPLDSWRLDDFEDLVDCRSINMHHFADSEEGRQ